MEYRIKKKKQKTNHCSLFLDFKRDKSILNLQNFVENSEKNAPIRTVYILRVNILFILSPSQTEASSIIPFVF